MIVVNSRTLTINPAQYLIIAIGGGGVGTVGGFVVGFEGAGEFTEAVIGAAKDVLGTHSLVGIAMTVEVRHQGLRQGVIEHLLTAAVLLFQRLQLLAHLSPVARATGHQPQDAQAKEAIYLAISHLDKILEGFVILRGVGEAAVDEADQFHGGAEAELFVTGTIDVLIEQILEPVFLEIEAGS